MPGGMCVRGCACPGGRVHAWGCACVPGVMHVWGCACSGTGMHSWGGAGGHVHAWVGMCAWGACMPCTPPGHTDTCEKHNLRKFRLRAVIISHGWPPIREFPSALDTSVCRHSAVAKAKSKTKSVVYPFLYEMFSFRLCNCSVISRKRLLIIKLYMEIRTCRPI